METATNGVNEGRFKSEAFKRKAVARFAAGEKPADIARDMGFHWTSIYTWQKALSAPPSRLFSRGVKRAAVAEMRKPGADVKAVAKKYGCAPWTIYAWMRKARVPTQRKRRKVQARAQTTVRAKTVERESPEGLPSEVRDELLKLRTENRLLREMWNLQKGPR